MLVFNFKSIRIEFEYCHKKNLKMLKYYVLGDEGK